MTVLIIVRDVLCMYHWCIMQLLWMYCQDVPKINKFNRKHQTQYGYHHWPNPKLQTNNLKLMESAKQHKSVIHYVCNYLHLPP